MMDDLISRQAAIDAAHKNYDTILDFKSDGRTVADSFEDIINVLPSAQPERKKGKWIADVDRWGDVVTTVNGYICSECKVFNTDKDNFCPNCGADMRERKENPGVPYKAHALNWCVNTIRDLPTAQQWISCSEKLPKEEKRHYWVCTDTGYQCQCRWTNDVYGLGASDRWEWKIFDIPQYQKVIAWMPLPKPYKQEEKQ